MKGRNEVNRLSEKEGERNNLEGYLFQPDLEFRSALCIDFFCFLNFALAR